LLPDWRRLYDGLIDILADSLSERVRRSGFIEIILMTYSYVHRAITPRPIRAEPSFMIRLL
jgi:spore photoproduct lyase